jgi:hypothetical protein
MSLTFISHAVFYVCDELPQNLLRPLSHALSMIECRNYFPYFKYSQLKYCSVITFRSVKNPPKLVLCKKDAYSQHTDLLLHPGNKKHNYSCSALLTITNSTRAFARNDTGIITERCKKTYNKIETIFVLNQFRLLRILMDFDDTRSRVTTTD